MKHQFKHRVIYQDTDAEGVVYYANYLGYFERGRTELLRSLGISIKELKEQKGIAFAITRVECDYRSPALLDDEITILTEVEEATLATMTFRQKALRNDKVLVSAKVVACAISLKHFRPTRLPQEIIKRLPSGLQ